MDDFRETRRKLGLTQAELADQLGLHQSTISRFESGAQPVDDRTQLALEALLARKAAVESASDMQDDREWPIDAGGKSENLTAPEMTSCGAEVPHVPFSPTCSEMSGQSPSKPIDASQASSDGRSSTASDKAAAA